MGGAKDILVKSELYGDIPLDFLFVSQEHECPYLPGRAAREEAFSAPRFPAELYHDFMDHGFRRSGEFFYRPKCAGCQECRPLRTPVERFRASKSQRRALKKNRDVVVTVAPPALTREKEKIYERYCAARHGWAEGNPPPEMEGFLYSSPVLSLEFEYRLKGRLMAVSITDVCSRSISSVYTYFDPDFSDRSPGTFSAIHEIRFCLDNSIGYYYLGYYVAGCPAMNYKVRFKPHEILAPSGAWLPDSDNSTAALTERHEVTI